MPLKHAKMSVSGTAARSLLNTWQPDHVYAVFEQTCHLNMPTWAWAEHLHAPRWIPDSQIKSMQVWNKHATKTCQHGRELNSCTLAAWTATSRPLRCAETALQNTIEVRTRATQIAAPKPDLDAQKQKNDDFEALFQGNLKRKIISAKMKNPLLKHRSQLSCTRYNTIYDSQLPKTMVFRKQGQQRGTFTQPFHCDQPRLRCKTQ